MQVNERFIVVSITTISSRIKNINKILTNLERQSLQPNKVILYYSSTPWHLDKGIPNISLPKTKLDVEVIKVPNRGSCRKYLYTIERYRRTSASILLLDDDLLWDRCLIQNLFEHQNKYRPVVGTRGWSEYDIIEGEKGEKLFFRPNSALVLGTEISKPTEVLVTSSGWATMFYAKDVNDCLFNTTLQKQFKIEYSDEIFLSAMLPKSKFIVPMPKSLYKKLETPPNLWSAIETQRVKAIQSILLNQMYSGKDNFCNDLNLSL